MLFQLFEECILSFKIGKFLIKTQHYGLHSYLGLKSEPWYNSAGSKNACMLKRGVATQLLQQQFKVGKIWPVFH